MTEIKRLTGSAGAAAFDLTEVTITFENIGCGDDQDQPSQCPVLSARLRPRLSDPDFTSGAG